MLAFSGLAYSAASPADRLTPDATEAEAAYRATGHLNRLAVMRAAIEEAGFAHDVRDEALRVMDQTREGILKLVKSEAASPSAPAERERNMREARDAFSKNICTVLDEEQVRAVAQPMSRVTTELELLRKDGFTDALAPLSLSEKQTQDVTAVVDKLQETLKGLDSKDGVPVAEKQAEAVLAARLAVRGTLTDEQKSAWDAQLDERRKKDDASLLKSGTIRVVPGAVKPAPPVDGKRD